MKLPIQNLWSVPAMVLLMVILPTLVDASEIASSITGTIEKIEPSKSILIKVGESRYVEKGMSDIRTLAIVDSRKLSDGVIGATILGSSSGAVGSIIGVVNPPNQLSRSNNKLRNTIVVAAIAAGFSATAKCAYNRLKIKKPIMIYDTSNSNLNKLLVLNSLSPGTRIRITYNNHVNGVTEPR